MQQKFAFLLLAFLPIACSAQPGFTADEAVTLYDAPFGFGSNMGVYPPYNDETLAGLVCGTPDLVTAGIGVNCIRPALPEEFLDYWGYTIRENTFHFYDSIGLKNNTVFLGFPAPKHRDSTEYCPGKMSVFFKNMYEPIWDNGENGTPVNDKNYAALYIWKTIQVYGPYVKFWEVWNEPDFDIGGNAYLPVNIPGNWWLNTPKACETTTNAPVFHYIRLLRIAWEVIKDHDPEALVCVGGIGYPSYLDVLCRFSDNPNEGKVSTQFPKKGGAYFDCLSYHSYPHIEGATRAWDNSINGFKQFRHSDACVDGVWKKKSDFDVVLSKYKYDGTLHPKKHWIITEFNIPRKEFGDYIGSAEAQNNFMIKTLAMAQAHDIDQMYVYNLADNKIGPGSDNEFSYMGFFKNLEGKQPFDHEKNQLAVAFKTVADQLSPLKYDAARTAALNLPADIRGVAFQDSLGKYNYVMWAATSEDRSETASADYVFPANLNVKYLTARYWNNSATGGSALVNGRQIKLTGTPIFLKETTISESAYDKKPHVFPNPSDGSSDSNAIFSFYLFEKQAISVQLFDNNGKLIATYFNKTELVDGAHQILIDSKSLSSGVYFIKFTSKDGTKSVKMVRV
jgi:hypothetical protein